MPPLSLISFDLNHLTKLIPQPSKAKKHILNTNIKLGRFTRILNTNLFEKLVRLQAVVQTPRQGTLQFTLFDFYFLFGLDL